MEKLRKARNLRSRTFFLLVLIITPILFLGCASGKFTRNSAIFRDSSQVSYRKDSTNKQKSHWQDTQQHDSTYKQDSVVVYIKGDTVIRDRWHQLTTIRWKTITKTDTVQGDTYICVTDTVRTTKYIDRWKTKEVEKPRSALVKARLFVGDCVILLIILLIVSWAAKTFNRKTT